MTRVLKLYKTAKFITELRDGILYHRFYAIGAVQVAEAFAFLISSMVQQGQGCLNYGAAQKACDDLLNLGWNLDDSAKGVLIVQDFQFSDGYRYDLVI